MKIMLSSFAVLFFTTGAFAEEVLAPFGLTWGETKSQLEAKGVVRGCKTYAVETCRAAHTVIGSTPRSSVGLTLCSATPTKPAAFGNYYGLVFDSANALQCVLMASGTVSPQKGKAFYVRAKSSLVKKYGKPSTVNDEFYCRENVGCENFGSAWEPDGGGRVLAYIKPQSASFIKMMNEIGGNLPLDAVSFKLEYESPERAAVERARNNLRKKQNEASDDSAF